MDRVWLVSEFYYPVVVTTGYYVTEIADYLSKKGMNVGVISTNNTYYDSDVISNKAREFHNGIEVYRVLGKQVDKDSLKKRSLRLLSSSISLFNLARKQIKEGDEVIILTNPAFFMLFMPLVRKLTKCHYHILVHDIFPENLVSLGNLGRKTFLHAFLNKIFDWAYGTADSCISIGEDMRQVVLRKTKGQNFSSLITNWADVDEVKPLPKVDTNLFKEMESSLTGKIVFQFAGNLGKTQGLDNLMNAIDMVKNEDCKFLFVGAGAKKNDIESFAERHENTVYAGFRSRLNQNDFLNACDIGIVTLADGMYGLGVPSKSYNIMATGKPILYIGESDSEIALCLKRYNIGWVVEPNNPSLLKDKIEDILREPSEIQEMGANALTVANEVFAKSVVLEQYYDFIKKRFESR